MTDTTHQTTSAPTTAARRAKRTIAAGMLAAALTAGAACIPSGSTGTFSACRDGEGTIRLIDKEGGATCKAGETLVEWNQQGPQGAPGAQGPAGPAGATAVLDTVAVSGHGWNPSSVLDRLGVHATVDVPAGAKVHLVATKTVGTTGLYDWAALDAWLCHRPAGSTAADFVTVGEKLTIILRSGDRIPVTLSTVIEGLPAGQHEVGLCGSSAQMARWTDNSTSYVTAMVLAGP